MSEEKDNQTEEIQEESEVQETAARRISDRTTAKGDILRAEISALPSGLRRFFSF